jgi:hypothetical protein
LAKSNVKERKKKNQILTDKNTKIIRMSLKRLADNWFFKEQQQQDMKENNNTMKENTTQQQRRVC